jgi:hypothetical protein
MNSLIQCPTVMGLTTVFYPPENFAASNLDQLEPLERAWHYIFRKQWGEVEKLLESGSGSLETLEKRCNCSLWSLLHDTSMKDGLRYLAKLRYGNITADDFRDLVGRAAEAGQLDMVKFYLEEITSITEIESSSTNKPQPLHRATTAEVVGYLLSRGANVNFKANVAISRSGPPILLKGATPLYAITELSRNDAEPLHALLVSPDVDKMAQLDDGNTLLHFVVLFCSSDMLEPILEMGFDNDIKNAEGITARELAKVRQSGMYAWRNKENIFRNKIFQSWDREQIKKGNKKRKSPECDSETSKAKRVHVSSPIFHTTSAKDIQQDLWMDGEWFQLSPDLLGKASRSEFVVYDFHKALSGTGHLRHAAGVANSAWEKVQHRKFSTELDFSWQPFIIETGTVVKNKDDMIKAICKALGAPDAVPQVKSISTSVFPTGDSSEDGVRSAAFFLRKEAKNVVRLDFVHEMVNTYPIIVAGVDKRDSDGESIIVGTLAVACWT